MYKIENAFGFIDMEDKMIHIRYFSKKKKRTIGNSLKFNKPKVKVKKKKKIEIFRKIVCSYCNLNLRIIYS